MSPAGRRALERAAYRERGNICPVVGVHAAAETQLINALDREGYVDWDNGIPHQSAPRINATGRAMLKVMAERA